MLQHEHHDHVNALGCACHAALGVCCFPRLAARQQAIGGIGPRITFSVSLSSPPYCLFQFARILHGRVLDELSPFREPSSKAEDSQARNAEADDLYRFGHSSRGCRHRLNRTRHGTAFGGGNPPREIREHLGSTDRALLCFMNFLAIQT